MGSLYEITLQFWMFWFGETATEIFDTLQLLSVICVIALVMAIVILPILKVISGFRRRR